MRNYVIKYVCLKGGDKKYFECRAETSVRAIGILKSIIDDSSYHIVDIYINMSDVK